MTRYSQMSTALPDKRGEGKNMFGVNNYSYDQEAALLYSDGQIHIRVNRTIEVESASRIEWSDSCTIVAVKGLIHGWSAGFHTWFRRPIHPGAVLNDMFRGSIINKVEHITLGDSYRVLDEVGSGHMHGRAASGAGGVTNCAGAQYNAEHAK